MRFLYLVPLLFITFLNIARSQVIINEGSNRNYSLLPDENGEFPDWIELYNIGNQSVNLNNYSLTDDADEPAKWTFPNVTIDAHGYLTIFCSGKDRRPIAGFVNVRTINNFTPIPGWNTHNFTTPFYWDGVSNILINTCSYSSTGYTSNSVFKQTATSYNSTSYYILDGSNGACSFGYGTTATQRPNIKLNGH
ncbi:MAG TPA: lamin tail domain-containing protein, partial [Prolixibacteraceae bacterium]|nr:lamin tail domain-containing protein [Prolixibacteraceae bacterium]